jgi:hypothetical protein
MKRNTFRSLLVASLVACSGSGSAGAQTTGCQRWAVTDVGANNLPQTGPTVTTLSGNLTSATVPDGWEPIGGVGSNYMLRKCIQ